MRECPRKQLRWYMAVQQRQEQQEQEGNNSSKTSSSILEIGLQGIGRERGRKKKKMSGLAS